ncbi:MAG: carboxymuconolactone decarboxylase family protein [Steroidobacteraceae bacterium]
MERLGALPAESLDDAQRRVAATLAAGPRGALRGPFVPLLRSPELCDRTQHLGEFLRYQCSVPERLRELAIIQTARLWQQTYEWHVHAPLALRAGVASETIAALAAGHRPERLQDDEALIIDFCVELHGHHSVSDGTYARALALLGERGVVDLVGLCGYYALLAMVLNVAQSALPAGSQPAFAAAWE